MPTGPVSRWRSGCGRARWTRSSASRTCSAPGSPLRRLAAGEAMSVFLWGPPGSGKTTIAAVVSRQADAAFVELSAVTAGVKEVRAVLDQARRDLRAGRPTVLFVDEVHRFSKTQQDVLLPAVENRLVTLVAATTENPSFSVISPLLSRSLLLTLKPLTDADVSGLVDRALVDERGLAGAVHAGRGCASDDRPPGRWRRPAGADLPGGVRGRGAGPGPRRHLRRRGGAGGGQGRDPLRPGRRPALRRDQRVHQVGPWLRRPGGAALPGPDGRGGGGSRGSSPAGWSSWPRRTSASPTRLP